MTSSSRPHLPPAERRRSHASRASQVLLPAASGELLWQPFDPLHRRRAAMSYVTVAVGRDYGDVSPTRGSFRAPYSGWLAESRKRAGVLHVVGSQ